MNKKYFRIIFALLIITNLLWISDKGKSNSIIDTKIKEGKARVDSIEIVNGIILNDISSKDSIISELSRENKELSEKVIRSEVEIVKINNRKLYEIDSIISLDIISNIKFFSEQYESAKANGDRW